MRSEGVSAEKLHCDLSSLLPLPAESDQDMNVDLALLPTSMALYDIELPRNEESYSTNLDAPEKPESFQGLMDNFTSEETCSDLVSTFVSDAVSDPVSLDDFII